MAIDIHALKLNDEQSRCDLAIRLFDQFCDDMKRDPSYAKCRMVASIQVATGVAFTQGADAFRAKAMLPRRDDAAS